MSTQAEDAAQNLDQWIRALLTDTLDEQWPGISVESEKVGESTVLVTAVSFADGSRW